MQYGVQGSGNSQTLIVSEGVTISGLQYLTNYTVRVAAVNRAGTGVYSDTIIALTLGKACCELVEVRHKNYLFLVFTDLAPMVELHSRAATTISLSWTSAGSEVDSYEVMWERDTSGECPDEDQNSTIVIGGSTSYTITGLEEDSSYTITVTATNTVESAVSDPVTGMTGEAGEGVAHMI